MKKLALIVLAAASLVGTAGVASAQHGGGYYGERYSANDIASDTTMTTDIIAGELPRLKGCRTASDAFVRGALAYKTASASHIAATEIDLLSWSRKPEVAVMAICRLRNRR